MKLYCKSLITASLLTLIAGMSLQAQTIQNVKASFQDGKAFVTYDLIGGKAGQKYAFDLYSSHNNYITPLRRVVGDIGKNIDLGTDKKIEWDAAGELGAFKGDITFKVRGEPIAMAFSFKTPAEGGFVRRGKTTVVQWDGGKQDQNVQLELFEGSERIQSFAETKNNGSYTWELPKDMKMGSYTLKLKAGQETTQSGAFTVKSKIPMLLKLAPILVLAGVAAALSGGGGGGGTVTPEKSSDLPAAPGPK